MRKLFSDHAQMAAQTQVATQQDDLWLPLSKKLAIEVDKNADLAAQTQTEAK